MRFGIIANRKRPGADDVIKRVIFWTQNYGHDFRLCEELRDFATETNQISQRNRMGQECDIIISMGGDGTLLATSRDIGAADTPILGINLGSLGFLTQVSADEVETRLNEIIAGKYRIESRMLLEASVDDDRNSIRYTALNDVVVDRGSLARLIQLDLFVNDEFISTYRADGLVICTPTGSTAYNSAVGGPLLNPNMEAIVASPIAPQSLAARPLLFHGEDVIRVRVTSSQHTCLMTVDGQTSVELANLTQITVRKAGHSTRLITFEDNSFYKILRTKLHWAVLPVTKN
ncbi:MAG: NAD(+)/NADH kinase [Candidatus Zixiibacteriota bacterium]